MSDTPRTDEAQFGTGRVSVDFARQLERELAEANQRIRELTEWRPMETAPRGGNLLAKDVLGAVHIVSQAVTPGVWLECETNLAFTQEGLSGWLPLPKGDA